MAYRGARTTEFEERDYYGPPPGRSSGRATEAEFRDVRVREREREPDRMPAFLREDARRTDTGPLVLRQRDVETFDRRHRTPSPPRVREERLVRRPKSPEPSRHEDHEVEHEHTRIIERERDRVRSPSVERRRSPSVRYVEKVERRQRSPSPTTREHIRIIERDREKEREPSPESSPSPPPPPPVVRGPTIEREVITHYRDIDHGTVQVRPPSPPPAPRQRPREEYETRETDIDISLSKDRTDVDIHRSSSHGRSGPREQRPRFHDDELIVRRDGERLRVDEHYGTGRRARSAAPLGSPVEEEGRRLTGKIDSRGRMGEAWNGATKRWEVVDVPPGTERVRMDGVGGGSTDTSWSRYSGERQTKFVPERDGVVVPVPREASPPPRKIRERERGGEWDHELEIDIDRRTSRTPQPPPAKPAPLPAKEMWTEVSKDIVLREAIEQMGYGYEESREFFYITDYLPYDMVLRLTELSEDIRRSRKDRVREIEWERDYYRDDWDRRTRSSRGSRWEDERVSEHEVIYDSRRPARRYY